MERGGLPWYGRVWQNRAIDTVLYAVGYVEVRLERLPTRQELVVKDPHTLTCLATRISNFL